MNIVKEAVTKSRGKFHAKRRCASIAKRFKQTDICDIEKLPNVIKNNRKTIIGTLSFPVCRPKGRALRDNSDIIAEIVRRRRPGLLLCAGWSVRSKGSLAPVNRATQESKTMVVLETSSPKKSWRIEDGRSFEMGEQCFWNSKNTESGLRGLARDIPSRWFRFSKRKVFLLICGEVTVIKGRENGVTFRSSATPPKLKDAVQEERVLILNPTHTRMGNAGTLNAWRGFLSQKKRVYVSASNWDVGSKKAQHPSETLHEFWHDAKSKKPCYCSEPQCSFSYREWELPQ